MDKKKLERRLEAVKTLLILLLSASAIYLTCRTLSMSGLEGFWSRQDPAGSAIVGEQAQSDTAWPVRMAAASWSGDSLMRFGVQYDGEAGSEQFQQAASLLREALSNLGEARLVTRQEWETALSGSTSLYFDFLGHVPLSALSGWLSGEDSGLESTVRRLIMAAEEERVTLYYYDEDQQGYFARQAEVVGAQQFSAVTQNLTDNGAVFAFEQEQFAGLAGDTMILASPPQPRVYSCSNPLSQTEESGQDGRLSELLLALSFPDNSYSYPGTDQVIRSGGDTLRISAGGVVSYSSTQNEPSRYQVASRTGRPTLYEAAEACRALADGTVGAMSGAARLYLREVYPAENGWQIDFGYCLDGAAVHVGEGLYAARFVVEGDEITQFVLQLRHYTDTGERSVVLPEEQAMAAMAALGLEGGELELSYRDTGGDTVTAGWMSE